MIKKVAKWAHCVNLTLLFCVDLGVFANRGIRGILANLANLTNLANRLANLMMRESCDFGDSCESTDSRESLALFAFSFWIAKCLAIWILDLQILLHTFHSFVIIAVAPKCASLLIKLRGFFVIFFHAFALFVHNA